MSGNAAARRAFTLIELLVVVAIIGLLISILLPSLREAREQARVAKCISNLRQLGLAANGYRIEDNGLPFVLPSPYNGATFGVVSEFIWGGEMPDKTVADWNSGLIDLVPISIASVMQMDAYQVRPKHRPLNPFIVNDVYWDREKTRTSGPATYPEIFRCPSDRTAQVPFVGGQNPKPDEDSIWRMWEFWGSSYPINWYWPYYYMEITSPRPTFRQAIGQSNTYTGLGPTLLREKTGGAASEFVLFAEGQMNYALAGARPPGYRGGPWSGSDIPKELIGWHRKLNRHAAGFLDGSARYDRFDTRFLLGSNWTIWPNKPWAGKWGRHNTIPPTDENAFGG